MPLWLGAQEQPGFRPDRPCRPGLPEPRFFSRRVTATGLRDPETARKICAHAGMPVGYAEVITPRLAAAP
jgi:hypothetical protein